LIQEVAGGDIVEQAIDICGRKPTIPEILLSEKDVEKHLGQKISWPEIVKILKRLRFSVKDKVIIPPPERTDINIKEDVIEEIARIYGYENIPAVVPGETLIPPEKNEEYLYSNWARGVLIESGFSEVYNYSFSPKGIEQLELLNPVSREKAYLRNNLREGLQKNIKENFKNFDVVKLFEIGKVFCPQVPPGSGIEEKVHFAAALDCKKTQADIAAELRGIADALFIENAADYIHDNVLEIELAKIIESAKDNIDLSEIPEFETKDVEYRHFSRYPAIIRDISLFVPIDTQVIEVMDVIENTAGELLVDTDLFDLYEPANAEKKSVAFRLIFQSFEKTLTDKEVNKIMDKIIKALEENIKWEVRKK
jgi:phenylalanyl-tRNA synthetase beta chain